MFLSRVEIPWQLARNPYDFHRHLWRLFPGEPKETRMSDEEARQGFLFRIEGNPTGCPARLLLQSRRSPEPISGLVIIGTREFHPQPFAGQRLSFVLTANPVKTIIDTQRDTKPGKTSEKCRVPLIREVDQREWLTRKLGNVAKVEAIDIQPHTPLYFRKGNRGGKLATVAFNGILKVSNPAQLIALLEKGVGPAKGFGCALLLVRRV